ncbi:MAG: serine/threonine-protein kinase [Polyangiaceae bacterium]
METPVTSSALGAESEQSLLEALARERVGTVLRRKWRLDAVLGVGGFGAVYSATHRTGSAVAVKVLHRHLATSEVMRQRFLREAYLANKVDHPGVVTVLDDDIDDDGVPFMIMELLEGMTVEQWAETNHHRVAPGQVLWIADRLLDVLEVAHGQGVVHRDIKPENLFITNDGRLEVLDFGLARLAEVAFHGGSMAGIGMGTPSFTSPEQARGEWDRIDGRTDLYAVGATMYALLAGERPREHLHGADALLAAMNLPLPSIARIAPTLAPSLVELVDRALAFDRQARFPDARTMRQAVRSEYRTCTGHELDHPDWGPAAEIQERVTSPPGMRPDAPIDGLQEGVVEELASFGVDESTLAIHPGVPIVRARLTEIEPLAPAVGALLSRRDLAESYLTRGLARHRAGDLTLAIEDYSKAVEYVPVHAIAYFNRGVAQQAQGDDDAALLDYGRAIDRQKGFAEPYYNRAGILRSRGQLARAATDAARALELFRSYGREVAVPASLTLLEDIQKQA